MNKHLQLCLTYLQKIIKQIGLFHKEQRAWKRYTLYAIYIGIAFFVVHHFKKIEIIADKKEYTRSVEVKSVASLAHNNTEFPFPGTVTSINEATIRSESSGKLVNVTKRLGDKVEAGEIIATFENSAERASLLQSEGAYEAAKAGSVIALLSGNNSAESLEETKNSALNTINATQSSLEDAVRVKTDSSFSNPRTGEIKLLLSVPNVNLVYSLEAQRTGIEKLLTERAEKNKTLTKNYDLILELTSAEKDAQTVKNYLDDLAKAYNIGLADSTINESGIANNKALISSARSEVSGAITAIAGARTALQNSLTAKSIAEKTGGDGPTMTSAEASIKQALGIYNAAQSRYEKTIIRSPLSGTLNSLSIKTGDFITAYSQIGVVSNNGTLEVKASVGEDDAKRLVIGSPADIKKEEYTVPGVITSVAEAIDPLTKKIEVRIAIKDANHSLLNGDSVTISVSEGPKEKSLSPTKLLIPLSSLKMTPDGAFIFTISTPDSLAHAHKVKEGAIFGENIEILDGLTENMSIVVDARGLQDNMPVIVK
jgi:RND family efflux transporter MFP subunit